MPHPWVNPWQVSTSTHMGVTCTLGYTGPGVVRVGVQCHAPNTFGTVNMECTVDSRLSWSER